MKAWRHLVKSGLARVPAAAEILQRRGRVGSAPPGGYRLERLAKHLRGWVEAAALARGRPLQSPPKRLLLFGYLPWWLEYAVALALLMRAQGHEVDLAYLPYRRWQEDPHPFDVRRQRAAMRAALAPLAAEIGVLDLTARGSRLPGELARAMVAQSDLDVQYTLGKEQIEGSDDGETARLLETRRSRNRALARAVYPLLRDRSYDAVVIPNGSILEFGALYRTARYQGTRCVTYEFGERRRHMWLAQDAEVMRLPTDALWAQRGDRPLQQGQLERLRKLYIARKSGRRWSQFARQWQRSESEGAQAARAKLGLSSERPVALLCTNVVGDSLALDRQVFTRGMADWLSATVRHFADRPQVQLVVRVHPGEMLGAGHPSVEIVRQALPQLPPQVFVVPPQSEINTYDLIELAHLGLVYTTTVGLEMAMFGVPVVVSGATHFRGKGFTHDPQTMQEYLFHVDRLLERPPGRALPQEQMELAWRYAYLFFFEFPFPFPWHLLSFWEDMEARPLEQVVRAGRRAGYDRTLRALAGESVDWARTAQDEPRTVSA